MLGLAAGDMTAYGLPKPDHKLLEAHPTVSAELLSRLGHGDIEVKPNIDRFAGGRTVRFADGSEEEIDLVVYCTGYKITFPFFDASVVSAADNRLPLYRRVASVEHPGLYFIGFIQPLGAIMPIAEAQSEWVADLLGGRGGAALSRRRCGRRSPPTNGRCGSATSPLSVTRSRWTSTRICARSGASESGLRSGSEGEERGAPPGCWGFRRAVDGSRRVVCARTRTPLPGSGTPSAPRRVRGVRLRGRIGGRQRLKPSSASSAAVLLGGFARPPDQPEGAEDRDLQHDEQEEDRPEAPPSRLSLDRVAQAVNASTWTSSRPRWDSVGTSRVGCSRSRAHS